MQANIYHGTHREVRGELIGSYSLFLSCGFLELNISKDWWQESLPIESAH